MLNRSLLRTIKSTIGRYLAIFAIIALGVGFFIGIRVTSDAMKKTADRYLDDLNFYDLRLVSTLGLTEEDVEFFRNEDYVEAAEGSDSADVIFDNWAEESEMVFHAHMLLEDMNGFELLEGRLPEKGNEVLVDGMFVEYDCIGETLRLSDSNPETTRETFAYDEYTIVGVVNSSLYINYERGTTSLGDGTVTGYCYMPKEGFAEQEYYTELYLRLNDTPQAYTDAYDDYISDIEKTVEKKLELRGKIRYLALKDDAQSQIDDAQAEIDTGWNQIDEAKNEISDAKEQLSDAKDQLSDAKKQLSDAESELTDGRKELDDGWQQLSDAKATLNAAWDELADAEEQLEAGRKELDEGWKEYYAGVEQYNQGLEQYEAGLKEYKAAEESASYQLSAARSQLSAAASTLANAKETLETSEQQITDGYQQLEENRSSYETAKSMESTLEAAKTILDGAKSVMPSGGIASSFVDSSLETVNSALDGIAEFESAQAQLEEGIAAYEAGVEEYNAGVAEYNAGLAEYEAGEAEANSQLASASAQLASAKKQLEESKKTLEEAQEQLASGELTYAENLKKYNDGLREYYAGVEEYEDSLNLLNENEAAYEDGLAEYNAGLKKYTSGVQEYNEQKETADTKIADANAEIESVEAELIDGQKQVDEAKQELADLEAPSVFVLGRDTNISYVCLANDAQIVEGVAKVFPVFFFLVAALVCITTMNRMVDEQRTENGTLKALGFGDGKIISRYLIYSGSASVLGSFLGFFLGSKFLPEVIWQVYLIMYDINRTCEFLLNWKLFFICLAIFLTGSLGSTYLVTRKDLREVAAELIRPKAPTAGKRVFLERIPFIWSRLSFLKKVSVRNIFLYRKRLYMMILGIGGCMALLIAGFGIRDSIKNVVSFQYDEVQVYDATLTFIFSESDEELEILREETADKVESVALFSTSYFDYIGDNGTTELSVYGFSEPLDDFMKIHTGNENLEWPGKGEIILNYRIADDYNLKVGDAILLRDADGQELHLTLTGIFDNYIYNYGFVSEETFQDQLGYVPDRKSGYANFKEGVSTNEAAAAILNCNNVANVSTADFMVSTVGAMLTSMDYIVYIVLVCAGALAFIVLYNLTNITITERKRELATLKVLGFHSNESAQYVFRENLILTAFGIVLGFPLGNWLLAYIMKQVKINAMYFPTRVLTTSYIICVVVTFVFAILVDLALKKKIDRVDMAESMKAIE